MNGRRANVSGSNIGRSHARIAAASPRTSAPGDAEATLDVGATIAIPPPKPSPVIVVQIPRSAISVFVGAPAVLPSVDVPSATPHAPERYQRFGTSGTSKANRWSDTSVFRGAVP